MYFQIAIVLHFIALSLLTAGGFGSLLLHRALAAAVRQNSPQLPGLAAAAFRLSVAARIGSVLMLATGFLLAHAMDWVEFKMGWFLAKLTIYLVTWGLSFGLALPAASRLFPAIARRAAGEDTTAIIEASLARLALFHALTVVAFLSMVSLVVYGTR